LNGPTTVNEPPPGSPKNPFSFSHAVRSKRCTALTTPSTYTPSRADQASSRAPRAHAPAGRARAAAADGAPRARLRAETTALAPATYASRQRARGSPASRSRKSARSAAAAGSLFCAWRIASSSSRRF